jgi:hypothetical protein
MGKDLEGIGVGLILSFYPEILLEGLRYTTKKDSLSPLQDFNRGLRNATKSLGRDWRFLAKILTRDLSNVKQGC